ncbi:MAG: hypothetical protein IPK52_15325 [Chloroflexi bacterium]|nr:hypothetical protein [Chloroflexota bacterium]
MASLSGAVCVRDCPAGVKVTRGVAVGLTVNVALGVNDGVNDDSGVVDAETGLSVEVLVGARVAIDGVKVWVGVSVGVFDGVKV